jgi:hypothetical protein
LAGWLSNRFPRWRRTGCTRGKWEWRRGRPRARCAITCARRMCGQRVNRCRSFGRSFRSSIFSRKARYARKLLGEYMYLRGIDALHRTPAQTARYYELSPWYNSIYRPWDEAVSLTEKSKQAEAAKAMREGLKAASVPFEKRAP